MNHSFVIFYQFDKITFILFINCNMKLFMKLFSLYGDQLVVYIVNFESKR